MSLAVNTPRLAHEIGLALATDGLTAIGALCLDASHPPAHLTDPFHFLLLCQCSLPKTLCSNDLLSTEIIGFTRQM